MSEDQKILDCGHPPSPHEPFTTGYGIDENMKKHCYECCHKIDLESLKTEDKFFAYLSSDRKTMTNWLGNELMTVENINHHTGQAFGKTEFQYLTVTATDVHGNKWHGRGTEPGAYVRMRKAKP